MRLIIGPEWPAEGYPLTLEDAIYSLLADNPKMFMLLPSRLVAYVFVTGRGLVRIIHDFRFMSDDEAKDFISRLRWGTDGS